MSDKTWPVSMWSSDGKSRVVREGPLDPGQIEDLLPWAGSGKPWGADDIAELRELREMRGEKYITIAEITGRTYHSVRSRGQRLGLRLGTCGGQV